MESFGARMKREREKRKITLEEISLATKIGTRFLLAIEEEHFDQLPGGIFNKGFVKAYARHVGIDEAQAVADYELASAPPSPPESLPGETPLLAAPVVPSASSVPSVSTPPVSDHDPGYGAARIPWGWFAVALLIVAFAFAVWGFHSRDRSAKPGLNSVPPPVSNSSAPADPIAPQAGGAQAAPAASAPEVGNATAAPSDSQPAASGLQTSSPAARSTDPASIPGAFLVQIKAREDSWITISADGRQIMQDTLYASAEKSIGARDQIVIKTGNAGALDISFNGKKLPTQGAYNEVKTLTFDPNGLKL